MPTYNYDPSLYEESSTTTTTQTKLNTLADKKAEKLAKIGNQSQYADLSNTHTILDTTGTIESNANKIYNEYTPEEQQYLLGYATSKYYNPKEDSFEVRRLYDYGTSENGSKGGVSTGGASTSDVRYSNTVDPRFTDKWRTTEGSTLQLDKKNMDIPLDFAAATVLEGIRHGNKFNLENRKYPDYLSEEALNHPGGVSEYYKNTLADQLGDYSKNPLTAEREKELEAEFDKYMKLPGAQAKPGRKQKIEQLQKELKYIQGGGYLGNLVDMAQYGVGRFASSLADTAVDTGVALAKGLITTFDKNAEGGNFERAMEKRFGKEVYDAKKGFVALDKFKDPEYYGANTERIDDVKGKATEFYKDPSIGSLVDLVVAAGKAGPEVFLTSLPEILASKYKLGLLAVSGNFANDIGDERAEAKGGIENLTAEDRVFQLIGGVSAGILNHLTGGNVGLKEASKGLAEMGKAGYREAVKTGTVTLLRSYLGEGLEEATQDSIVSIAGKINTANEKEIGSEDFWIDTLSSFVLGGSAGNVGTIVVSSKDLPRATTEILDNYFGNEVEIDDKRATTQAGRKNRFESFDGQTPMSFENEKEIEGYVADITEYAIELWNSDELKKGTEYEKTPTKIWDDAVDRVANARQVTSKEGKELIKGELSSQILAKMRVKDKKTGQSIFSGGIEAIKSLYNQFKDSPVAKHEFERAYEEELQDKFAEIRQRIDPTGKLDAFSTDKILTEEELVNVQKTLEDMRKLGSEELTSIADKVETTISKRQEILGSQDGGDLLKGKSMQQVRDEIEELGFILKGKAYKSIKQHKRDLEDFVVKGLDPVRGEESLKAIEKFVGDRQGKVRLFDESGQELRVRTIGEIKVFAEELIADNLKLRDMLKELEAQTEGETKVKFTELISDLDNTQAELYYLRNEKDSDKIYDTLAKVTPQMTEKARANKLEEARVAGREFRAEPVVEEEVVEPVKEKTPKPKMTAKQIDETLDKYKPAYDRLVSKKAKGEELTAAEETSLTKYEKLLDARSRLIEKTKEDKKVKQEPIVAENVVEESAEQPKISDKETTATKPVDKDVVKANVEAYKQMIKETEEELATLQGYIEEGRAALNTAAIEEARKFRARAKKDYVATKDEVNRLYDEISKYRELIKSWGSDKGKLIKDKKAVVSKIKEMGKELAALGKLIEQVKSKKEVRGDLLGKISIKLEQIITNFKEAMKELKSRAKRLVKAKLLRQEEADLIQESIDDLSQKIENVRGELDANKDRLAVLKNVERDYRSAANNLEKLKEDALAEVNLSDETLRMYKDQIIGLKDTIRYYREEVARGFRADIEEVLGDSVKLNSSKKIGLTARLWSAGSKTVEVLKEIVPSIIKRQPDADQRIEEAVKTFETFSSRRSGKLINQTTHRGQELGSRAVLVRTGLDKLFNTKGIEDKVVAALNMTSMLTMYDMMSLKGRPTEILRSNIEGAFGHLWSGETSGAREYEIDKLMGMVRSGDIVPISTFVNSAGRRFLEELEIKLNLETMQDRDDVIALLGNIVVDNILASETVKDGPVNGVITRNSVNEPIKFKDSKIADEDKKGKTPEQLAQMAIMPSVRAMSFKNVSKVERDAITRASIVFEYAAEKSDGMISLKPKVVEKGTRGRNSDMKLTDAETDYINLQNSRAWKFDSSFANVWNEAGKDTNKLVELLIGTKEDLVKRTNPMDVESELAKYVANELTIERMVMAYELVGDKEFYFNWDYIVSNRSMIDNKMINPQSSKLSRFIISMDGMRAEVKAEAKSLEMTNLAIAQALGFGPDKKRDTDVIKELKEKQVDIVSEKGKVVIKKLSKEIDEITSKDVISIAEIRSKLNPPMEELMHIYQAMELIRKIRSGEKLETNLAFEADGITNGMATTLTQMGFSDEVAHFFDKVGLYTDESEYSNHGDFRTKGGKDFYMTPIEPLQEYLDKIGLENVVNDLVPKGNWREFLKPLVMVFIYGASITNIRTNGSLLLASQMVKNSKDSKELVSTMNKFLENEVTQEVLQNTDDKEFLKAYGNIRENLPKTKKWMYDLDKGQMKVNENGKLWVDENMLYSMAKVIDVTVGEALAASFNDVFEPVNKYRRVRN